MVTTRSLEVTRSPDGSTNVAGAAAAAGLASSATAMVNRPGFRLLSTVSVDRDRAHEVVALGAGVFAGGLAQLVVQRLVDVGEPRVILGAERGSVKSLGTMRRPLTSTLRLSSISRKSRRPSSTGRMLDVRTT